MSEAETLPTVLIVHPDLGEDSVTDVPAVALPHYYRAGWRRLTDDETQAAGKHADDEPPPMTRAQAAKAARGGKQRKEPAGDGHEGKEA